jgi:hypothetical protein
LVTKPVFKKILLETKPPVNCIIGDGILGFVGDVAIEVGVPFIYFRTVSACSFWAYFSIFDIIEGGQLPIRGISTPSNFRSLTSVCCFVFCP